MEIINTQNYHCRDCSCWNQRPSHWPVAFLLLPNHLKQRHTVPMVVQANVRDRDCGHRTWCCWKDQGATKCQKLNDAEQEEASLIVKAVERLKLQLEQE